MNKISKLYIFFLFSVIYAPDLGAIDMKAPQWLYINILNVTYLLYILVYSSKEQLLTVFKNRLFISFLFFFIACIISVINSINIALSIERLADIFTILTSLLCVIYIAKFSQIKLNFVLILLTIGLVLEVLGSLNLYRQIVSAGDFGLGDANDIRGFYGNKNITAAAIAFKIPFVLILLDRVKKIFFKALIYVFICLSFFTLLVLSARAVYLSVLLCIAFLIFVFIIKSYFNKKSFLSLFGITKHYILTLIIAIIIFLPLNRNEESVDIASRVQTVVENRDDESISQRLRFYNHAINQISSTPLIGCGIGNWKVVSIKYESKNMYSYVVPFFTHNDFLEIFAETGILGLTPFIIFITLIFRLNFTNIKLWFHDKSDLKSVILAMPLIVYFVDMNLNFPLARPSMQILLLLYVFILLNNSKNINADN